MTKVRVPIAEVSREATTELLDLLNAGESIDVTLSSEGKYKW